MLKHKNILVTGGGGFLGKYVVDALRRTEYYSITAPTHKYADLTNREQVQQLFYSIQPDVVIHLAAAVGGIEANAKNPGKYFYQNIVMGAEVMHAAMHCGAKYVGVGTSCSYPASAPTPVKETDLWSGYPNPTTAAYGVAKLALITMAQAYHTQYGMKAVTLIPVNLYGPLDSFDDSKTHVIPALIKKAIEARDKGTDLHVWGSGNATREFLYVADCAGAIVKAADSYNDPAPVNLGTGVEVSIRTVAQMIAKEVGFMGDIVWDSSKPDGQLRRCFDVSRAKEVLGWEATTPFETGLKRTIDWWCSRVGK